MHLPQCYISSKDSAFHKLLAFIITGDARSIEPWIFIEPTWSTHVQCKQEKLCSQLLVVTELER